MSDLSSVAAIQEVHDRCEWTQHGASASQWGPPMYPRGHGARGARGPQR